MTRISRTSAALPLAAFALLSACSQESSISAAPQAEMEAQDVALLPEPVIDAAPEISGTSVAIAPAVQPEAVLKGYSTATPLRTLLEDSEARAVLQTHMPMLVRFAPRMPAAVMDQSLQAMAASPQAAERGGLTPDVLRQIDQALADL